jgi:SAM-dependent methyltransferase
LTRDAVEDVVRSIEGSGDFISRLRRVARLAMPLDARIAVVTRGDDALLELGTPAAVPFPPAASPPDTDDPTLIADLESLRANSFHFLVVPAGSRPWFDGHPALKRHVEQSFRVVVDETDSAVVFALREPDDVPADGLAPDGLPMPPPEMVHLTAGLFHNHQIYRRFYELGAFTVECMTETLEKNDVDISRFESILDFGGGCGRVVRHLASISDARLKCCDYNPYLVEWAEQNLPIAKFEVNPIGPPTVYEDGEFDLVYAISVFNHFVEPIQVPWARELARIVRPGGYVYLTVAGLHERISDEDRERYDNGELIVIGEHRAGTNQMAAFAPEGYIRDVLAARSGFELVDFVVGGARDSEQNAVLLRRL